MAANLKACYENSKQNEHHSKKQKEFKIKSRGLLAHCPSGKPPFVPWVEQESKKAKHYHNRAEYSAADEEQRIESIRTAKEQKLKKFQQDVKQRVKALEKAKELQQLDKSYEAVTAEQNIIYQSSFPKRVPTSKKNTCVYREANYASLQVGIPGSCRYGYSVVNDPQEVDIASELLEKQVTKVQTCTRHARNILGSQILNIDTDQLTELPGGVWNHGKFAVTTRGTSESSNSETGKRAAKQLRYCEQPYALPEDFREISDDVKDKPENARSDKHHNLTEAKENNNEVQRQKIYEKDVQSETVEPYRYKVTEDLMRPGRLKEQTKKQGQKQLAVYRRLFMNIEREQVRENLRMKEHRKRMTKLKNKQETIRKEVEAEIDQIIEERTLVSQQKMLLEEKLKEENYQNEITKEQKKVQKEKELERYVNALRATLKEKLKKRKLHVPTLCSCGPTIFDTNPETCANNCIFYKNQKGYAKALSSLLSTTDLDL